MNHQRAMSVLDNQTTLAQKVFKAVPIQDWWTVHQIFLEFNRQTGQPQTRQAIGGCLRTLREAGLIDESGNDKYRSAVKPAPVKKAEPMGQIDDKKAPVPPSLVERLMAQAQKLRDQAEHLDLLAMEIDDEITKAGQAGNEKLKLLRELLAS